MSDYDNYYGTALQEAAQFFTPNDEKLQLVSMKIRPTDDMSNSVTWDNTYVYEYEEIYAAFNAMNLRVAMTGSVSRGKVSLYKLSSGEPCLFVEHETGPEFIFQWFAQNKDALEGIVATASIIKNAAPLLRRVLVLISDSVKAKREGKNSKRFYDSQRVKIERRTVKEATVVANIGLPLSKGDISEDECADYIGRLFGNSLQK